MSAFVQASTEGGIADDVALRHALEALAARASRTLSSRAQARLELCLVALEPISVFALSSRLGPLDRAVALTAGAGEPSAFVWLSRELAFALLALRFGARPEALEAATPERAYTRIEERSLERAAIELWRGFGASETPWARRAVRAAGIDDATRLRERVDQALWLATFSVGGLSPRAQVSLALAAEPSGSACEAQPYGSGGKDEIEAKHGMDAKGASAPAESPDPASRRAAPSGMIRSPQSPERAVWIAPGATIELDGDAAGRAVLRVDGRSVAEGALVGGAANATLRVERILEPSPLGDRNAR